MSWARIDDGAMGNAKILKLSDSAFRLWVKGLCYCQLSLTDGLIPNEALPLMSAKAKDIGALMTPQVEGKVALWETVPGFGYKVHDYLDWNESKDTVLKRRYGSRVRVAKQRGEGPSERSDTSLRAHSRGVVEDLDLTNTKKKNEESPPRPFRGEQLIEPLPPLTDFDMRAGALIERYQELFHQYRKGARYLNKMHLFVPLALELVRTWADARLEKLAVLVLTTDDDWIARTDRGFRIFHLKAGWADDRLTQWEAENGLQMVVP